MRNLMSKKQSLFTALMLFVTAVLVSGTFGVMTPDVAAQNTQAPNSGEVGSGNEPTQPAGALPSDLNIFQGTGDSLIDTIITIVNLFLSLIGVALVLYLLYGGVRYAFAGGNETATSEAPSIITNAIIGIIIIALVYVLANFLVSLIVPAGGAGGGG